MRVLVVTNLYPPGIIGGYELACSQAAEALAKLRHEVLVLTSQPGIEPPAQAPPAPAASPVVERRLTLAPVFDGEQLLAHPTVLMQAIEARSQWIDSHNTGALVTTVERFRPDVAYLWNLVGVGGLGLLLALRVLDIPWVWHLCDRVPFQLCSERGFVIPSLAEAFGHLAHGRWITLSDQLTSEIGGLGMPLPGKVTKLPMWIHTEGVPVRLPEPAGDRPLRLGFAGQVARHKGAGIAIDAAIELRRHGVPVTLELWGEILDLTLPGRASAAGLSEQIIFHGPMRHRAVLAGLAGCDLLVFPTWPREPFGVVPAEAAAVGTPPILAPSGVAEWLDDGKHAIHVPRSVDGVVDAVRRVHLGEIDLVDLARNSASRVRSDLMIDAIMPAIELELQDTAVPYRPFPRRARRAYALAAVADRLISGVVDRRWT